MPNDPTEMTQQELLRGLDERPEYMDEIVRRMRHGHADSIVPKMFRGGFDTLDDLDCETWRAHRDRIQKWAEGFTSEVRKGLYLSGPLGCGKSRLGWNVVETLITKGYQVSAWNVSAMFDAMLNSFGDPYCEPTSSAIVGFAQSADLLFLDDLGTEPTDIQGRAKAWVVQKLYTIGNHRLEQEKPILVTSNMIGSELSQHMKDEGRRFIDRLCGMIELPGMAFNNDMQSLRRLSK